MKLTLENPPEGFAADLRIDFPKKGDYILPPDGPPEQIKVAIPGFPCIILTPLPATEEKRVERCEVYEDDGEMCFAVTGYEKSLYEAVGLTGFRGCVYRHPNGREKVFGFCHPIFVRSASEAPDWDWSHAQTKQHTTMLRPAAVLMEVEG